MCISNDMDFILRRLSLSQPLAYFTLSLHKIFDHIEHVTTIGWLQVGLKPISLDVYSITLIFKGIPT
jgi:hypothetical protein